MFPSAAIWLLKGFVTLQQPECDSQNGACRKILGAYIVCRCKKGRNMNIDDPRIQLPAVIARNQEAVRGRFWPKLVRGLAAIPFAQDLLSAYYCAQDPQTPMRAKAILLAALGYFIMPADLIPDFIVGLGFTDDLTVLLTAIAVVRGNITQNHLDAAEKQLSRLRGREV